MKKVNIAFIGSLTNGYLVADYLINNKYVDLKLIITQPENHDSPRFKSFKVFSSKTRVEYSLDANAYLNDLEKSQLDYIFVAGWSGLINKKIIDSVHGNVIGFHPSKLPLNRGRSVLAWQIEDGTSETALSMFYYNDIPDGGDIIAQEDFTIERNDYINDVLDKVDFATYNLMKAYFPLIRKNQAPRKTQNMNDGNFRRLRSEIDSTISWNQNAESIYNKIRAISKPYPGANAEVDNVLIKVWRAEVVKDFFLASECTPGTKVAQFYDDSILIKCRDYFVRIIEFEKV